MPIGRHRIEDPVVPEEAKCHLFIIHIRLELTLPNFLKLGGTGLLGMGMGRVIKGIGQ